MDTTQLTYHQNLWRGVLFTLVSDLLGTAKTHDTAASSMFLRRSEDISIIASFAGFDSGFAEKMFDFAEQLQKNNWNLQKTIKLQSGLDALVLNRVNSALKLAAKTKLVHEKVVQRRAAAVQQKRDIYAEQRRELAEKKHKAAELRREVAEQKRIDTQQLRELVSYSFQQRLEGQLLC